MNVKVKLVCINNTIGNTRKLKLNHTYVKREMTHDERINTRLPYEYVIIEMGEKHELWCQSDCFISLEEFRDKQLEKLL